MTRKIIIKTVVDPSLSAIFGHPVPRPFQAPAHRSPQLVSGILDGFGAVSRGPLGEADLMFDSQDVQQETGLRSATVLGNGRWHFSNNDKQ
jgi:hypothetical protein